MSILNVLILGAVQGLTEFLPISSSGHLLLLNLLNRLWNGVGSDLSFITVLHLGTFLALIIYFRQRLKQILISFFKPQGNKKDQRLGFFVLFASLPTLLVGFFFRRFLENSTGVPLVIAFSLIIWGVFIFYSEKYSEKIKKEGKERKDLDLKSALMIGLTQVIALIPGTSRSGITLGASLFSRLEKSRAVEFSFLLGLPTIFCAGLFEGIKLLANLNGLSYSLFYLLIGLVLSFLTGFLAIKTVFWLTKRTKLFYFSLYRIFLGLIILVVVIQFDL